MDFKSTKKKTCNKQKKQTTKTRNKQKKTHATSKKTKTKKNSWQSFTKCLPLLIQTIRLSGTGAYTLNHTLHPKTAT